MVIGDSEKLEWSKHTYILPPVLKNVVGKDVLRFAGVTDSNEIVFGHPSCVIYYNIEKNTIVKVRIQGMEAFQSTNLSTFLDHKEVDPKLMEAYGRPEAYGSILIRALINLAFCNIARLDFKVLIIKIMGP
ncbi:hypothetical protein F2Q68_00024688 [Brassica cretica]|nr:hypothetical protein F2Q68_00024688 [Brassica cretica]